MTAKMTGRPGDRSAELNKRLMAYSLMAGTVLGHGIAGAAVQKASPGAILTSDGETFNVVFGGQTKFQIRLRTNTWTTRSTLTTFSSTTAWSGPYSSIPIGWTTWKSYSTWTYASRNVGVYPMTASAGFVDSGSYARALNGGATIDSGQAFQKASGNSYNMAAYSTWGVSNGEFLGNSGKYLGLVFQIGGLDHYGWVQVDVNSNASQVDINTQAWEDVAGLGIIAGSDVSLPVESTQVTAEATPDGIALQWATESETDHLGFVIGRRASDQADAAWETVASWETHPELAGQGNRSSKTFYRFTDVNVETGSSYEYRITDVDIHGKSGKPQVILVHFEPVIPETLALHSNYPNPFNPSTTLRFDLPERGHVRLRVFNMTGQEVAVLLDDEMNPGVHEARFDASAFSAGLYFCELSAGEKRLIRKMHLIK